MDTTHPPSPADEHEPGGGYWNIFVRGILVLIAFAATGFCFYECSRIASAEAEMHAVFGGKPLPNLTEWVLDYRFLFIMLAAFVPCAALATFALRERWQALGALLALILFASLHAATIHGALALPYTRRVVGSPPR